MGNMVTKVVTELNEFDNVIYQSSIEPFKGDGIDGNDNSFVMETTFDNYINSKIVSADAPKKHLISQNRGGEDATTNIKNDVSVLSWDAGGGTIPQPFFSLNKPLSDDEVTYLGRGDVQYRRGGWKWIISGGAVYNMLDLSFTPYRSEESGTKIMPYTTSNGGTRLLGGSASLRTQLGILNDFIHSFDFVKMVPDNSIITGGAPTGTIALVEIGKQYAIYLPGGMSTNLIINLPAGNYKADWVNTKTGNIDKKEDIVGHTGGNKALLSPIYSEDIALRILSSALTITKLTITTNPSNQAVNEGQNATFSVIATSPTPLSYQWQKNGVNIAGAINASYTSPQTTLSDSGSTFRVNVTNPALSVWSSLTTLTVLSEGSMNVIKNPGFESGTTSWLFYTNGVGPFTIISPGFEGNSAAKLALSNGGTNIQLYQDGITLEANTLYRLSFAAYSTTGHDVTVNLIAIPYAPYGLKYTVNLSKSWQIFTTEFTTKGFTGTVSNGRLQFWLSPFVIAGDAYNIDAIVLEKV
jgi:hypothetical protein